MGAAIACSHRTAPTTAPSGVTTPTSSGAAADGSTLKATAPAPVSPINGVTIPNGTQVTLVVTNSTVPFVTIVQPVLSYRFELQNANGTVVESQVVPAGQGTTSRVVAAPLGGQQTFRWRARAAR